MPKGFSVALIDMLTFPSGPFPTSLDVGVVPYVMKGGSRGVSAWDSQNPASQCALMNKVRVCADSVILVRDIHEIVRKIPYCYA